MESQLANAEMGDYRDRGRERLPWSPPLRLTVRARFSHLAAELGGTSGFGFWNNPFAQDSGDVQAPPNTVWFFCASPRSEMVTAPGLPGNGFRAEMINGGRMPRWLIALGNRLLQVRGVAPLLYRLAQTQVQAAAERITVDPTYWHEYVLSWGQSQAVFSVDAQEILRVSGPPAVPLGFVAWMDNQWAVARPDGTLRFGLESIQRCQWLELDGVEIEVL